MKTSLALALLLLSLAPQASGRTIRQIELRGNSRILSVDAPMRRGRLYLFHRYPDGVYMSVPAEDVLGIAVTTVEDRSRPGDTVLLGPTGEGQPGDSASARVAASVGYAQGYPGYYGYGYCYGCPAPPVPPPSGPPPPALVGPNGFPLLPGSPPPLPIGPNGFPILNPSPPRPR